MNQKEARLHDAKLGAAIEDACSKLPDDCIIDIVLERGAATVSLDIDGATVDFPTNYESLHEEIRDAINFACEKNPSD